MGGGSAWIWALAAGALGTGGPVPERWIHGAPDCATCTDPMFQVHELDRDTYVLRMSKCANFEAPFLYLLIGTRRALLLDSGARPVTGASEIRAVVDAILTRHPWGGTLELAVAHSHGHGDHRAGDVLFENRPRTAVVGTAPEQVRAFFGLESWPEGEAAFELGDRTLRILPIPGHEPAHISVYDPRHQLLLTGDTLYPGLLTIRDWPAYRASVRRLDAFARTHPVSWILGAHVEMTARPREMYPLETTYQPEEHPLPLGPQHLHELAAAVEALGEVPRQDVYAAFILAPVQAPDRPSVHGMLVVGEKAIFLSHLPLFHSPHDYQVILEARLPEAARKAYAEDRRATGERVYTVVPEPFVLPEQVQGRRPFKADLYRGHFERGGQAILEGVTVEIVRVVHFRRLNPADVAQGREDGLLFGRDGEAFLAHRIAAPPDFDQVVSLAFPDQVLPPTEAATVRIGGEPLKDGQCLDLLVAGARRSGTVIRALYTEFGDLKE